MADRTTVIIQGTAWGVQETQNGRRFLRVSCKPGFRDRNGQWVSQPEQSYSVWPAGFVDLAPVFDQISQLRQDQDTFVDVTIVGEVSGFRGYETKTGEIAASCTVNASAVAITNVRRKNGGQGDRARNPRDMGYQGGGQPADPWKNGSAGFGGDDDPAF